MVFYELKDDDCVENDYDNDVDGLLKMNTVKELKKTMRKIKE
jgi:hypothetical protein